MPKTKTPDKTKHSWGAGKMAPCLRALVAETEDRVSSQHPHGGLQLSVTLVLEALTLSSDLHRYQSHMKCTYIYAGKTHKCIK